MNSYTTTQLATARREALLAEATYHRHYRSAAGRRGRSGPRTGTLRRRTTALRAWIDAGQL